MRFTPFNDICLITLDEHPIMGFGEDGKPITPQIWHKHKPQGTIGTCGASVNRVKEGDRVLVNPYAVIEIIGQKQMLIREDDILALIEDEDGEQENKKN